MFGPLLAPVFSTQGRLQLWVAAPRAYLRCFVLACRYFLETPLHWQGGEEICVLALPGICPVIVASCRDGMAIHALPNLVPSVREARGDPLVKSCPPGTAFIRKRTLLALQGSLWQLRRSDALLRALLLPPPQQLPRRRRPLTQKIQISEFPGSKGHNPECRRVQMSRPQVSAGPFVSMRPHSGVLPTPPPDPPGRKTWVNPHIFGFLTTIHNTNRSQYGTCTGTLSG